MTNFSDLSMINFRPENDPFQPKFTRFQGKSAKMHPTHTGPRTATTPEKRALNNATEALAPRSSQSDTKPHGARCRLPRAAPGHGEEGPGVQQEGRRGEQLAHPGRERSRQNTDGICFFAMQFALSWVLDSQAGGSHAKRIYSIRRTPSGCG